MAGSLTVLMSVRVRATLSSGAAAAAAAVAGLETLRLQLSMNPERPGEFSLSLRDTSSNGRIRVRSALSSSDRQEKG